jgi:2-polyprenyl-6-methoxyphenol hydroxylase-like FAD-dependent oxidoreductase
MVEDHGSPYYHIHRGDYHAMLLRLARAAPGVRIRLNAAVRDVQPDPTVQGGPSVTLASGEVLYADVIIGADGVKSTLQKVVTGLDDAPIPTGDAAYRAIISTDLMLQDPDLRQLVETPEMTAWMSPRRHLMAYNIVSAVFFLLNAKRYLPLLETKSLTKCCVAREERVQFGTAPPRRRIRRILDRGRQRRQDACRFCRL